jgi:CDP-diacylglycerol--serine O-phosphatidyltransferase
MKIFTIPNFITLGNLLAGCVGIVYVSQNQLEFASICIFIALILDFFDGFVARILKSTSEIGKELDSLADVVSFGVLPAYLLFALANFKALNFLGYFPFLLAAFSALRLAKFNVDLRQSDSFIGLPTPANAMIIATFPYLILENGIAKDIIVNTYFMIAYVVVFSFLLVSEIPLMALKFKDFTFKNNRVKYFLIVSSMILLVFLKLLAIPIIVIWYIVLSAIQNLSTLKKEG